MTITTVAHLATCFMYSLSLRQLPRRLPKLFKALFRPSVTDSFLAFSSAWDLDLEHVVKCWKKTGKFFFHQHRNVFVQNVPATAKMGVGNTFNILDPTSCHPHSRSLHLLWRPRSLVWPSLWLIHPHKTSLGGYFLTYFQTSLEKSVKKEKSSLYTKWSKNK